MCYTYLMPNPNITDPAYWAITEQNGTQLITPNSSLYATIVDRIGDAEAHGLISTGDILVATKSSFVISPESIGIDRKDVSEYKTPERVAQGGLSKFFGRK